jgi:PAS domain S-box-containing protein
MRPELESIYRTAPIGLGVLDAELRFENVNQRLAEMNGIPAAAHIGRTVRELLPAIADQAEAMLRRVLETGEPVRNWEVRGETPAQPGVERIWIEQIVPLRDAQGRVTRLSIVAEEVTAQRRTQEAVRRQAQLLQLAFDAIFSWTTEQGIESWNHGAELQYGYCEAEALGRSPDELLRTVFPGGGKAAVTQAIASHGVWRGELAHFTKDGRRLTVAAVLQWVAGGGGHRILEITRDVTADKETQARLAERERELHRSQERLQVALDAGRMGVWDWTPGGEVFWSPEVYRLLGLPESPPAPDAFHFLQAVHADDRAGLDAVVARVLAKGGDYESEFRVLRADGEVRWLVSRGRVLHNEAGRTSRLVGVNFDITERKLVEQALQHADQRRTEFLATLSHELRNPLAAIANAVRLLELVGDAPERREAATQILRRQTTHLARLVDDLLEVSRITQGRIELRMENMLVATVVYQAVEAARPLARDRQTTFHIDVPPGLDLVADPARRTQVISNLVTNAVKYTQEGGRVEVLVECESEDLLSIAVQDNGPGIAPDLRPHLFELFTQDQRTLDRAQGGLGIGLALVKRLVELHGGHVRCENRRDGEPGARFVVCLPRKGRREDLRSATVTSTRPHLSPLPILVVDDNEDAAQTLASLLQLDGHRVEAAYDGEHALAAAISLRPQVVLLDLGLPKLDGLAVARRLRQDERFDRAVLIAMSGYAQASDREATAAAGFDAHLAKPVELADVYDVIEEKLHGAPSG